MGWLKWRDALKPNNQYSRTQFLFWFFVPMICIVPLAFNIWEFEKLFIRLSFYAGLLGYNTHLISQILSTLLALFLVYLLIIAMIKRCNDLNISGWWIPLVFVPIMGMAFIVFLLFWPNKTSPINSQKRGWPRTVAMSMAALVVFTLFAMFSLFSGTYYLVRLALLFEDARMQLRLWNQTDERIVVEFAVSDGVVYQGHLIGEAKPNEIIKNENMLFREGEYTVKAKDATGKAFYYKDYTSKQLAEMNWIILIPRQS